MKYLLLSLLALTTTAVFAQSAQQQLTHTAYVSNSETLQKQAVEQVKGQQTYEALEAYFVLLNGTMDTQDEELFNKYVDDAVDIAEELIDSGHPRAAALLASINGFKMAYSPMKGMFLGGKTSKLLDKALAAAPNDPQVLLRMAMNKYYTPEMWGGDQKLALEYLEKAVANFEAAPATLPANIHYSEALVHLGRMYTEHNREAEALEIYQRALAHSPDFGWVKNVLLPELQARLKS